MSRYQDFAKCTCCDYMLPILNGKVVFGDHLWSMEQLQKYHRCSTYVGGKAVGKGHFVVVNIELPQS